MLLLGCDVETTGLSIKDDRITEVGAVLWDTDRKSPVRIYSSFMWEEGYPPLTKEITELTGIVDDDLRDRSLPPKVVFHELMSLCMEADFLVAHNGTNFDRPMMEAEMQRQHMIWKEPVEWIDTSVDLLFPKQISTRKLGHLAAEHGFLNPFPHRAVFDVMTMLKVLSCYPIEEVIRLSRSPAKTIRAVVSFDDRKLASERGYRWNAEKKFWLKTVKECQLDEEIKAAPFKINVIEESL